MHLMRGDRTGLATLAGRVGVRKQTDWGTYLREIDKRLAANIKSSGRRSSEEQFYAEATHCIDNVRLAFRNPTMHPDKSYSLDRAEDILIAGAAFMRHLATQLNEPDASVAQSS